MQESILFLVRVQCRRKESSLSHLLMSFLLFKNTPTTRTVVCVQSLKSIVSVGSSLLSEDRKWGCWYNDQSVHVTFLPTAIVDLSPSDLLELTEVFSRFRLSFCHYCFIAVRELFSRILNTLRSRKLKLSKDL